MNTSVEYRNISEDYFGVDDKAKLPIGPAGEILEIVPEDLTADLPDVEIPAIVSDSLLGVSQLGLKEVWLGRKAAQHNRWAHSIGASTAGNLWLRALEFNNGVDASLVRFPLDTFEKIRSIVHTSLLLHDYGHLPFSHLIQDVLTSINWLPQSRSHSLETAVLDQRLRKVELNSLWDYLANHKLGKGSTTLFVKPEDIRETVYELVAGLYSTPWIQAVVNSPVDADKIDYLRYDARFLETTTFPVRPRLQQSRPSQWLTDFLSEQSVNHAGLLCLHGRSARAALDLWRERLYLYDRFYLSPEMRVPERMALEIIQQFAIHVTMSQEFLKDSGLHSTATFGSRLHLLMQNHACVGEDLIRTKFECVRDAILELLPNSNTGLLEFNILDRMFRALSRSRLIEERYREFLGRCFGLLSELQPSKGTKSYQDLLRNSFVREPLIIPRNKAIVAASALRPLQHAYSSEILIDLISLPHVLTPDGWLANKHELGRQYYSNILVPDGPIGAWNPGKRAVSPLTADCVKDIEQPIARVIVIAPDAATQSKSGYFWDRVRSALIEANIPVSTGAP